MLSVPNALCFEAHVRLCAAQLVAMATSEGMYRSDNDTRTTQEPRPGLHIVLKFMTTDNPGKGVHDTRRCSALEHEATSSCGVAIQYMAVNIEHMSVLHQES